MVRVRDCFEANNTAYIVMDYEDGEPLDALLERHGTLTEAQLKRVVLPVADGLRQVHTAGFLHRDVKPSNIFVRRSDESPVLLDFGSARQALGRRSRSMTAIASAGYSPPEQYESQGDQGAWTDIYALSALCHRAITGKAPVEAPRRTGEVARSRADPHIGLVDAGVAGYPAGLLEAVDCGLRLVETERPQSLDDWLARVERTTTSAIARPGADTSQPAVPSSPRDRSGRREADSRRRMAVWGLVCLGALLGIGWLAVEQGAMTPYRETVEEGDADTQHRGGDQGQVAPSSAVRTAPPIPKSAPAAHPPSLQELAERGDADAQLRLGKAYANGEGGPKDAGQAALWYRKAAEQGVAEAQYALGALYADGDGVLKDTGEAVAWYRKAAEQGHTLAQEELAYSELPNDDAPYWANRMAAEQGNAHSQYLLGRYHANGLYVPKDAGKAATWFRKAAGQGVAEAQYSLGDLYHQGEGIPKDAGEAVRWYRKAAEQGIAAAQHSLGSMYFNGEGVPEDYGEAARWTRKAAEQGMAAAQASLASKYTFGYGVSKDPGEAAQWTRKAAEQGDALAQHNLGAMYALGEGVPKDSGEAARWYRRAAEQGIARSQAVLAEYYYFGRGVSKDASEAAQWNRKAAEQGIAEAQHNLGAMYARGEGVPKDSGEAARWYRKAAEQGLAGSQYSLGARYLIGDGVPADYVQAYAWLNLAAAQGLETAVQARDGLQRDMTPTQIAEAQKLSRELVD